MDLLNVVDVVEWREAMSEQSEVFDIALIEGSIARAQDEEKLQRIRKKAGILVSLGACAVSGGRPETSKTSAPNEECGPGRLRRPFPHAPLADRERQGGEGRGEGGSEIRGCPIDRKEFGYIVRVPGPGPGTLCSQLSGLRGMPLRENSCLWEKGEICLGPLSRAGCDSNCPSKGAPCVGCRGFSEDANPAAMSTILNLYGKKPQDLESRLALFLKPTKEAVHA